MNHAWLCNGKLEITQQDVTIHSTRTSLDGREQQKCKQSKNVSPQGYAIAAAQGNTAPKRAARRHRSVRAAATRSRGAREKPGRSRTPHRSAGQGGHGKSEAPRKAHFRRKAKVLIQVKRSTPPVPPNSEICKKTERQCKRIQHTGEYDSTDKS
jgi:hypothetical protein